MNLADEAARRKIFLWILLLAALARLPDLGHKSIWGDEATSIYVSLGVTTANDHPPGYYLLSGLPVRVFGRHEFPMRLVAALFGLLLVWGIYRLGEIFCRIWPRIPTSLGWMAALWVAVSPYYIQLAQENRPYSMIAALTAWSCYFFLLFLHRMGLLGPKGAPTQPSLGPLAGYFLVMTVGIYSHYFIWLVLASQGLFWAYLFIMRSADRARLLRVLIVPILLFIFFLPILPGTISKVTTRSLGIEASSQQLSLKYYATRPASSAFHFATGYYFTGTEGFAALAASPPQAILFVLFALVPAAIFLAGLLFLLKRQSVADGLGDRWEPACFLLLGLLVTLLGAMTIDTSIARQHSISGVYFFMILSLGLAALPGRWRRSASAVYAAIIIASLFSYYSLNTHPFYRTDWRSAAKYLRGAVQPGDVIYVSYAEREGFYALRFAGFEGDIVYAKRPYHPENQSTWTDSATGRRLPDERILTELLPAASRLLYVASPEACSRIARQSDLQVQNPLFFGRDLVVCEVLAPPLRQWP